MVYWPTKVRFFTEKRREFIARSAMDVFKLLLPATLVSGLFFKPIPLFAKTGIVVGLAVLCVASVWVFPRGE